MIIYCYKTNLLHDHQCDACGITYITMCTKMDCDPPDELCWDCYCEYKRFIDKLGRMK